MKSLAVRCSIVSFISLLFIVASPQIVSADGYHLLLRNIADKVVDDQRGLMIAQTGDPLIDSGLRVNNAANGADNGTGANGEDNGETGNDGVTSPLTVDFANPLQVDNVDSLLTTILRAIQAIVASLAVLFIVIGAVIYLTSAGNASRLELAKNAIWAAIIGLALALAAPSFLAEIYTVLGQGVPTLDGVGPSPSLTEIVLNVLRVLLSFVGVLAVIMLVVGGLVYMLSAGDSGRLEMGKKIVIYAIVGLIIALVSLVIVTQVANVFA